MTSRPDPTTLLIDTPVTGVFETPDGQATYVVKWNRARSARYALSILPPNPTPTRPEVELRTSYLGQAPLQSLTLADRLPVAAFLKDYVAPNGPYTACVWCHRPLEEDAPRSLGMGVHCAAKHLGVSRKLFAILARHTPPTGPGTPVVKPEVPTSSGTPSRGHLRLVAVNGELVAA